MSAASSPERPSVSVVIGVYNGAATIERSVRSLLDQTLPPVEVIVVDDGSTDGTPDVLASLARQLPAVRVRSVPGPHGGAGAALSTGIAEASGTYVAIADDDDVTMPNRLAVTADLLERTGADMAGAQVVGSMRWPLRMATSRFPTDPEGIVRRVAAGRDPLPHVTMMLRRSSVDRFGAYRISQRGEDLELMLRWAHRGARIVVSPEVVADYSFRPEFFSVDTQTRWMFFTRYAREVAPLGDDELPEFGRWFSSQPVPPARREACVRVARLVARLAYGTIVRTS